MSMMIRPIVLHPDIRLKKKSVEVERITDAVIELTEDMMATMYDAPGIGLAAPQIGVLERIFVMDCLLYTSPSPRDATTSRMPSSA